MELYMHRDTERETDSWERGGERGSEGRERRGREGEDSEINGSGKEWG